MTLPSSRDLQGLRHPRHRRQDADARRSCARSARRLGTLARSAQRPRHDRDRPRRPPVRARSSPPRSPTGLRAAGADVIDLGMVATPMTYFAAQHLDTGCSVMVTGSHNPPDYNGLKMVIDGATLSGDDIQELRDAHRARRRSRRGAGHLSQHDIAAAYLDRIVGDVKLTRPMKHRGRLRQRRRRRLRADAVPRAWAATWSSSSATSTAHFPNHHPDPSQPEEPAST